MGKLKDIKGQKFRRLRVVGDCYSAVMGGRKPMRVIFWPCVCDCGTGKDDPIYIRSSDLISFKTKSCGCLRSEKAYGGKATVTNHRTLQKLIEISDANKSVSEMQEAEQPIAEQQTVRARYPKGYCKRCGHKLSESNLTGECWSHSVEDPYQNKPWEPHAHGSGIHGEELKPISEMATTSISAAAGRY